MWGFLLQEFFAGFVLGFSGLIAFVHTNFLLQFSSQFLPAQGFSKAIFASSLSFSKIVFELVPSIFFFVPSASYGVSVLPAQKLFSQGKGTVALKTTLACFFCSMIFSFALLPFVLLFLPHLHSFLAPGVGWALLLVTCACLLSKKRRAESVFAFMLSGALGWVLLSRPVVQEPLFPLLSGLFGIPAILLSSQVHARQEEGGIAPLDLKIVFISCILGAFSSLLPAMSPAFLVSLLLLVLEPFGPMLFVQSVAAVLVSKTFFDFAGLVLIGKARSGAAAFASAELSSPAGLVPVLVAGAASLFLAICVMLLLQRKLREFRFHGRKFSFAVLCLVALGAFYLDGGMGVLVLAVSASVGLCVSLLGVDKTTALGALILPSLFFFFSVA
ncbi:tripartite tricarboxylate transporter permease [Candidatus Micrarchaeota archaeon]|nr:tripartite tricarboxylate transporter permease [Candidatus Micrarchaeota archaeon]